LNKSFFSWCRNTLMILAFSASITGCGQNTINSASTYEMDANPRSTSGSSSFTSIVRVIETDYHTKTRTVYLITTFPKKIPNSAFTGEDALDISSNHGPINYATARWSKYDINSIVIVEQEKGQRKVFRTIQLHNGISTSIHPSHQHELNQTSTYQEEAVPSWTGGNLPPGVSIDTSLRPLCNRQASFDAKAKAVLEIARSKLGTPYIWGHNEDRGQYGFDCSNYTAYVYHHALGYKISALSKFQFLHVGYRIPVSQMKPGDLICFLNGAHVGIYCGNGMMIEEGGGLHRVGYLSLGSGSYWGKHISGVKRMF